VAYALGSTLEFVPQSVANQATTSGERGPVDVNHLGWVECVGPADLHGTAAQLLVTV
jgi:hypothetical protein